LAVRESYSIKSDRERGTAPTIVKLFVFVTFWGLIGFAVGTLILLGPVRWWATFCRTNGFSEGFESGGVVALILLLVGISLSLALWASTEWVRSTSRLLKVVLPLVILSAAGLAYWFWINPAFMQTNMADEQVASKRFTFGPFPDENRLRKLKAEGYTGVISLLHPAVVPFEPQLIQQEKAAAEKAGIEMIHLPMLPWVSDNKESLDKLAALAAAETGRYYIHCYLGEDRVNVARRIIEQTAGGDVIAGIDTRKQLVNKDFFERGEIYSLEEGVFLTPYPTDEELASYFLGGQIATVIALLVEREESGLVSKERDLFERFGIDYKVVPVGSGNYDPETIRNAVTMAKEAKKPVVIHAYFPASHKNGGIPMAFLQSYMTGKLPVPPQFFDDDLKSGPLHVVAPNVVKGGKPQGREWRNLRKGGVRTVIYAGGGAPGEDRAAASGAGLDFKVEGNADRIVELVANGGPYYVYGPSADEVGERVEGKHGPAVPRARRHDS
jgi:protein tyrosine phosphatase (PTP) superfamily phosphohydrolase (DUF442 family)